MTLLESVRRDAKRRGKRARAAAGFAPDSWKETEQALVAEVRRAPKAAKALVDAFARFAKADGSDEALGRAARLRGSWLSYLGRDRDAIPHYRAAAAGLTGLARDGARLGLAASLTRTGRFGLARKLCAQVGRDARRRGDAVAAASADLNEGVARHDAGDLRGAAVCWERARETFSSAGRVAQAAAAADNLANASVTLDRFDDADRLYEEAAAGFETAGAAHDATRCRMNRASLLLATDRLGEADALLRRCETEFRAGGDPLHAALSRRDRGEALLRAGLVPEARHAITTASRALGAASVPERSRTGFLLGQAAIAARDPAGARRAATGTWTADPAESLEIRGRAAALDGRFDAARADLERAADAWTASRPVARARCLAAAAWCAHEDGDVAAARSLVKRAERVAARIPVPSLGFAAAATRFVIESGAGRRADAEAALSRAASALESMRSGLGPEAMRAALLRGRESWLAAAVRFLLEGEHGARRALAFLERWRARSLIDLLADAGVAAARGDARVAAIRRVVAGLERRVEGPANPAFLRGQPAFLREHVQPTTSLLRRLREAEEELLEATERQGSALAAPATDEEIDRLRTSLPDGSVLVALFADELGGVAFVADASGVDAVHGLPTLAQTAQAVRDLQFAVGTVSLGPEYVRRHEKRLARTVDETLAGLADRLLGPVAERLSRARRVFVIPHGPWHHVPFAALPWRGGRLVDTFAVTILPALAVLRDPPAPATGRAVVVSVPDEAAPEVRVEAERVAATLDATLLAGGDATSEALASIDRPSCLHVAAHGRHRTDAPAASGVRLADGWFRAAEFAQLRLGGSLVVLSGCETGLTAVDAGDEVHGLVRGVLASGAADVISSLWRIDDTATARFMERFHALRAAGATPADALAAAQREQAAAGAAPWLWAGFSHHARRLG